jgi:hypothetical protein
MQVYEYRVVPAPRRGEKARGARTTAERFAVALAHVMNDLGREGWEYLRADTLPCDERVGLTGSATHFQHMLVFRRPLPVAAQGAAEAAVRATAEPQRAAPPLSPVAAPVAVPVAAPGGAAGAAPARGPVQALAQTAVQAEEPTRIVSLVPRAPEGAAPPVGPAAGRQPPSG